MSVDAAGEDAEAVISVTGTGAGSVAEDLPLVFNRFRRAGKSRSRSAGGSGPGLVIVRKLVEAHTGSIDVTNAPGQGTTFAVRLPGHVELTCALPR